MPKLHAIFTVIFLFFSVLFLLPTAAQAATCNFSYTPTPTRNMDKLQVTVKSNDLADGKYKMFVEYPSYTPTITDFTLQNGVGTVSIANNDLSMKYWEPGQYEFYVIDQASYNSNQWLNYWIKQAADCSDKKVVPNQAIQSSCNVSVITRPIDPFTDIEVKITGIKESNNTNWSATGGYDILINDEFRQLYETKQGETINIGKLKTGNYTLKVANRCGHLGSACWYQTRSSQCPTVNFVVASRGSQSGGQVGTPGSNDGLAEPPKKITATGEFCNAKEGTINTALGCIRTDPVGLVQDFFKVAVGIGGGMALLLMVAGAFQMVSSAGNPESIKHGKERFTSAIEGLLFIIFSILLLRIIGVDILGLGAFLGIK